MSRARPRASPPRPARGWAALGCVSSAVVGGIQVGLVFGAARPPLRTPACRGPILSAPTLPAPPALTRRPLILPLAARLCLCHHLHDHDLLQATGGAEARGCGAGSGRAAAACGGSGRGFVRRCVGSRRGLGAEPFAPAASLFQTPSCPPETPPPAASFYCWMFFAIACGILISSLLQQWSFAVMGQVGVTTGKAGLGSGALRAMTLGAWPVRRADGQPARRRFSPASRLRAAPAPAPPGPRAPRARHAVWRHPAPGGVGGRGWIGSRGCEGPGCGRA
jgi:hypothetical protein